MTRVIGLQCGKLTIMPDTSAFLPEANRLESGSHQGFVMEESTSGNHVAGLMLSISLRELDGAPLERFNQETKLQGSTAVP